MTQEENGSNQGEEEIFFELVSLKLDGRKTYGYNTEINKPILLSLKNCNLLGYFDERRIITNYRDTCSNVYRQINHFLVILTRNQNIKRLFFDWKINLVSNPTCFQLFKIDSSQIILSNFLKNLNLISYGLNSFQFEEQYKAIFNEAPLLNFPSLENWVFFLHSDYVELGDLILNYLHMIVKKFGYSVEKPKCILLDSVVADDWIPKIYENLTKSHKFCIVMIPYMTNNIDFYEKLKTLITGEIGVPCQFFQAQTLEMNKENDCFYLRLLSQIAAKLGVAPWALKDLSFSKVPTLAIGVNITCGDENKLIISVVGSMNKDFSKYLSIFSVLKDRNSYINEINQLVLNLLEKFFLVHNLYPQNLIIFRDGEFIEFCDEEKEVLNKNINDLKNKQKIQTFDLQLIYIKVKLSNKQNILAVEKINQMYQKKISNPYFGSIFKTSEEYNKFYIYLHRNDNDLEIMYPTQFDVTIFSKSLATKDFLIYLQTFCLQLVFLNFSFSSRTSCPAPLQYAYKLGKFIEIIERNKDKRNGEHDIINIKENLTDLSSKGKLYFI